MIDIFIYGTSFAVYFCLQTAHMERTCAENGSIFNAINILVLSNHNSFRVLFHEIASVKFIFKMY